MACKDHITVSDHTLLVQKGVAERDDQKLIL